MYIHYKLHEQRKSREKFKKNKDEIIKNPYYFIVFSNKFLLFNVTRWLIRPDNITLFMVVKGFYRTHL